jgi:hypothetical protein
VSWCGGGWCVLSGSWEPSEAGELLQGGPSNQVMEKGARNFLEAPGM